MRTIVFLAGIAGTLLIGGCASAPPTEAYLDGLIVCNTNYMDQVERAARRHFTEVHWINCPTAVLRVVKG